MNLTAAAISSSNFNKRTKALTKAQEYFFILAVKDLLTVFNMRIWIM